MVKSSAQAMPIPFRVFGDRPRQAVTGVTLAHQFLPEQGVLLVQPLGPLRASDFDAIAVVVNLWSGTRGTMHGLVIQAREFPGWENVAGFVRHVQFARDHQDGVRRVALATDVQVPPPEPELADHFIRSELKRFGLYELATAIRWASA